MSSGTSYDFFTDVASKYRLNVVKTTSTDDVVKALKNGALVIASMGKVFFLPFFSSFYFLFIYFTPISQMLLIF